MSRPRASVVVPSYNHGPYVEACLESALAADADLEVVVVDDGSSDDSLERLRGFAGDPRVRLYEQENRGAHAALNRGLSLARGDVLFLLNSDDLFERERIPRFLERFDRRPEVMLMGSWLRLIDGEGRSLGVKEAWRNLPPWPPPRPGPGLEELADPRLALLATNYVATTSNVALRRDFCERHRLRFLPLRYAHDWDFLLAAARRGPLDLVPEPLVRYRVHGRNTIGEGSDERGRGRMRFEILWLVARHAAAVLRGSGARGPQLTDLGERLWRSLPRFGSETLLAQLLWLRGLGAEDPEAYLRLLEDEDPFRQGAVRALGGR